MIPLCPDCGRDAQDFKHMHDTAYGMSETHMSGSERYECPCGKTLYADEGKELGLEFVLD